MAEKPQKKIGLSFGDEDLQWPGRYVTTEPRKRKMKQYDSSLKREEWSYEEKYPSMVRGRPREVIGSGRSKDKGGRWWERMKAVGRGEMWEVQRFASLMLL